MRNYILLITYTSILTKPMCGDKRNVRNVNLNPFTACTYSGGGGDPDPHPWDLSEVGSCVGVRWVREGVPKVVLYYYYILSWLPSLASNIHGVNAKKKNLWVITFKFKVHDTVIPNHLTYWTYDPWLSWWKCIYRIILSKITRLYTILTKKFLGEGPRTPYKQHILRCVIVKGD